jgi:hypothetical protein
VAAGFMYDGSGMSDGRQKVCPKCRAFLPRRVTKCPYCGRPAASGNSPKKRCRLCGGLEFKSVPVGEPLPGQKKVQRVTICAVCGKKA